MALKRKILAVLASGFFIPATTILAGIPVAHLLSHAQARDLTRGAEPQHALHVPLVDRQAPGMALAFEAKGVAAALAKWPGLTARLPTRGRVIGPQGNRMSWRVISDKPGGQHIQLIRQGGRYTQTLDYVATNRDVVPLRSRELTFEHGVQGMGLGLLLGLWLQRVMRWVQRRGGDREIRRA